MRLTRDNKRAKLTRNELLKINSLQGQLAELPKNARDWSDFAQYDTVKKMNLIDPVQLKQLTESDLDALKSFLHDKSSIETENILKLQMLLMLLNTLPETNFQFSVAKINANLEDTFFKKISHIPYLELQKCKIVRVSYDEESSKIPTIFREHLHSKHVRLEGNYITNFLLYLSKPLNKILRTFITAYLTKENSELLNLFPTVETSNDSVDTALAKKISSEVVYILQNQQFSKYWMTVEQADHLFNQYWDSRSNYTYNYNELASLFITLKHKKRSLQKFLEVFIAIDHENLTSEQDNICRWFDSILSDRKGPISKNIQQSLCKYLEKNPTSWLCPVFCSILEKCELSNQLNAEHLWNYYFGPNELQHVGNSHHIQLKIKTLNFFIQHNQIKERYSALYLILKTLSQESVSAPLKDQLETLIKEHITQIINDIKHIPTELQHLSREDQMDFSNIPLYFTQIDSLIENKEHLHIVKKTQNELATITALLSIPVRQEEEEKTSDAKVTLEHKTSTSKKKKTAAKKRKKLPATSPVEHPKTSSSHLSQKNRRVKRKVTNDFTGPNNPQNSIAQQSKPSSTRLTSSSLKDPMKQTMLPSSDLRTQSDSTRSISTLPPNLSAKSSDISVDKRSVITTETRGTSTENKSLTTVPVEVIPIMLHLAVNKKYDPNALVSMNDKLLQNTNHPDDVVRIWKMLQTVPQEVFSLFNINNASYFFDHMQNNVDLGCRMFTLLTKKPNYLINFILFHENFRLGSADSRKICLERIITALENNHEMDLSSLEHLFNQHLQRGNNPSLHP